MDHIHLLQEVWRTVLKQKTTMTITKQTLFTVLLGAVIAALAAAIFITFRMMLM